MNISPYMLTFQDKAYEQLFRQTFDHENRVFQRLGIVSGSIWWAIIGAYALLFYPAIESNKVLLALALFTPLGAIAFTVTYFPRLHRYYHWLSAINNLIAGFFAIYIGQSLLHSQTLTLISVVAVTFWVFFILRLRFAIGIVAALTYVVGYQISLLFSQLYVVREIFLFSATNWIIYAVCVFAARALEKSSRLIYFQKNTIELQRNQIQEEQKKSESLLLNILPQSIAEQLKKSSSIIADDFASATVLFADIVGFTTLSSSLSPQQVVEMLNGVFLLFDDIVAYHGLEKIKTIGDAYMAASGIPEPVQDHADRAANSALDMLSAITKYNVENQAQLQIRIGINSGPIVAGVIGKRSFITIYGATLSMPHRAWSRTARLERSKSLKQHTPF
jgi:adenylate cyclase